MFLARKITRAKWAATPDFSTGEIPADAVTVDLRTQQNSLSFWRCRTDTASDVEEAALAIAAAGTRIDRLDIVWLADDKLQDNGLNLANSTGRTPVTDMADQHVDLIRLDCVRLGSVARRVIDAIEAERHCRLTKAHVKRLIVSAIGQGRIDRATLHDRLREDLAS